MTRWYDKQPSLITLRFSSSKPDIVTQEILAILPDLETELVGVIAVTVGNESIRFRQLPIQPRSDG
ncbi:MAG: hypothetical protein AAGG51_28015 [Cyanobacteria bacterium P01_G01_bin.54]